MKPTTTLAGLGAAVVLLTGGIALAVDANSSDVTTSNAALALQTTSTTPTTTETTSSTGTSTPSNTPANLPATKIDPREAAAIAVEHVGGGTVTELERESEHGRLEWKVEVLHRGQEIDVRVDAQSGEVTRVDRDGVDTRDDDRDDARDDKQDDWDDRYEDKYDHDDD